MPICHTCQGEYYRNQCLCPNCQQAIGSSRGQCPRCGTSISHERLCPNCRSDVATWECERLSLLDFITRQQGFLALTCPLILAPVIWFALTWQTREPIFHLIAGMLATGSSMLALLVLFARRYQLRERYWEATVSQAAFHTPVAWMLITLSIGLVSGLLAFVTFKTVTPPHLVSRVLFGLFYGAAHANITASITLLVLQSYLAGLDQRVPQPIFVNPQRLVDLVLQNAAQMLAARVDRVHGNQEAMRSFELLNIAREANNCGIELVVREYRCIRRMDDHFETHPHWVEETWSIQADKWGRIQRLEPDQLRYSSESHGGDQVPVPARVEQADLFAGW